MPSHYHPTATLAGIIENIKTIPGASMTSEWVGPPRFDGQRNSIVRYRGGFDFSPESAGEIHKKEEDYQYKLRGDKYQQLLEEVQLGGIDALAWYHSFHYDDSAWGIYIPESSLYLLADVIFWADSLPDGVTSVEHRRMASAENLRKAWLLLWAHEFFHFATDLGIARWESILRRPLWAFDRFRRRREGVSYWLYEEKAANAHMLRHLRPRLDALDITMLDAFTLRQPPGYSDALEAVPDCFFRPLLEELMRSKIGILGTRAVDGLMDQAMSAASLLDCDDEFMTVFQCPVYILCDAKTVLRPSIKEEIVTSLPRIEESKQFSKMLSSMHSRYKDRWARKKAELAQKIPPHPEFEKLAGGPPPIFSIRLSRSARAHIRHRQSDGVWEAFAVGEHTKMGHD